MNCTKCNTPHPNYELHEGLCPDCVYYEVVKLREVLDGLVIETRGSWLCKLDCDCDDCHKLQEALKAAEKVLPHDKR